MTLYQYVELPPCNKCQKTDRMENAGKYETDHGTVLISICLRCAVIAYGKEGRLPGETQFPGFPIIA